MTAAEVLASAAESLRRNPESWYRRGASLATVVANIPGAGLQERGEAAALLRAHLDGDPGDDYFLADWSEERGHEEAIGALDGARCDQPGCPLCDPEAGDAMSVTPDTDAPVEHRQTIVRQRQLRGMHFGPPEYRRECSCGWRGVWLRNPEKVAPCPRAQEVR